MAKRPLVPFGTTRDADPKLEARKKNIANPLAAGYRLPRCGYSLGRYYPMLFLVFTLAIGGTDLAGLVGTEAQYLEKLLPAWRVLRSR
jgi:hypothetical protein